MGWRSWRELEESPTHQKQFHIILFLGVVLWVFTDLGTLRAKEEAIVSLGSPFWNHGPTPAGSVHEVILHLCVHSGFCLSMCCAHTHAVNRVPNNNSNSNSSSNNDTHQPTTNKPMGYRPRHPHDQPQQTTTNTSQHQPTPTDTDPHQPTLTHINPHQPTPTNSSQQQPATTSSNHIHNSNKTVVRTGC